MTNYLELPTGAQAPERVNAVIEIPLESSIKFAYHKQLHALPLARNLYSAASYPGDYGFIPSTLGDDGDPLDVIVLVDRPSFPGCLMEVRPIGALMMVDGGEGDEKILCVGTKNPRYTEVTEYTQILPHVLMEIAEFFATYKNLEKKRVEIGGWKDAAAARELVTRAQEAFTAKKAAK